MRHSDDKPKQEIPVRFRQWWEPWGHCKVTGASIGGHPEAYRLWARPEKQGYSHRHYGIETRKAWIMQRFRDEYDAWVRVGMPNRPQDFISISGSVEKQGEFWKGIKTIMTKIGQGNDVKAA